MTRDENMSTNKCVVRKLKDSFFNNLISAENVSDSICLFYGYPPPAHFMSKSIIYLLYVSLIYLLCPTGTTVDNYRPNISCLRRYLTVFVRLLFTAWGNFCAKVCYLVQSTIEAASLHAQSWPTFWPLRWKPIGSLYTFINSWRSELGDARCT